MRLVVIAGGEGDRFGEYHARQLRRGGYGDSVEVVTGDWPEFLRSWLRRPGPDDQLVPAPLSPHFLRDWLAGELGAALLEPPRGWALPFEAAGADRSLYLSAAAWTCPATCVEPAHCPVLHGPRDWDLGDVIEAGARERGYEAAVFRCLHFAAGVATVPALALVEARERLRGLGGRRVVVATSSRCHAALGALQVSPG